MFRRYRRRLQSKSHVLSYSNACLLFPSCWMYNKNVDVFWYLSRLALSLCSCNSCVAVMAFSFGIVMWKTSMSIRNSKRKTMFLKLSKLWYSKCCQTKKIEQQSHVASYMLRRRSFSFLSNHNFSPVICFYCLEEIKNIFESLNSVGRFTIPLDSHKNIVQSLRLNYIHLFNNWYDLLCTFVPQ